MLVIMALVTGPLLSFWKTTAEAVSVNPNRPFACFLYAACFSSRIVSDLGRHGSG